MLLCGGFGWETGEKEGCGGGGEIPSELLSFRLENYPPPPALSLEALHDLKMNVYLGQDIFISVFMFPVRHYIFAPKLLKT